MTDSIEAFSIEEAEQFLLHVEAFFLSRSLYTKEDKANFAMHENCRNVRRVIATLHECRRKNETASASEELTVSFEELHAKAFDSVIKAANMMGSNRNLLQKFIRAEEQSHSIMPILNPTFYREMQNSTNIKLQLKLAEAAIAFLRSFDEVKREAAVLLKQTLAEGRKEEDK